ncbi:hypothetical protein QJS10_CPB20g00486 [Acorus calamus]|uniref:Uncharacterized protein n=1 Tax=Acorus calamus TaxID=4465 RepID=A0AAV9C9H0_ACOCL|nr:hypothetical protein QJS10_CPB20g00486 [Acorus calamus]
MEDHDDQSSVVPVHVVTQPSQLPSEFLEPSADRKLVIGFDCEGVDLCRNGSLCVMQARIAPTWVRLEFAFPDAVYLVDVIEGGRMLVEACKPALESSYITKVIHDCKRDSEALYYQFGIKLHRVMDTQTLNSYAMDCNDVAKGDSLYHGWTVGKAFGHPNPSVSYDEKGKVRDLLRKDPQFWTHRPMTDLMIRNAVDDVRFLLCVYHKMIEKLTQASLWHLEVRGSLYCQCFCINDDGFADWPSAPPIPDELTGQGDAPEAEILSVLQVPSGQMGRVIGRRGYFIKSIKESCNADIFIGDDNKGPPNMVFIIGPVKEVRKVEAIVRGRFMTP